MNINLEKINIILIVLFIFFLFMGCGINEDQRNFEDAALTPPAGITEMTINGKPVKNGEIDNSDWRIAPEFSGLVNISTAPYPNPVPFNGTIFIELYITGVQAVNGLQVFVYRPDMNRLSGPFYVEDHSLAPGLTVISFSASEIAKTGTSGGNLHRIIIYDTSQNIITYGDIKVSE